MTKIKFTVREQRSKLDGFTFLYKLHLQKKEKKMLRLKNFTILMQIFKIVHHTLYKFIF